MVNGPRVGSDGPYHLSLSDGAIDDSLDWLEDSLKGLAE
jgi:hypothetical protein